MVKKNEALRILAALMLSILLLSAVSCNAGNGGETAAPDTTENAVTGDGTTAETTTADGETTAEPEPEVPVVTRTLKRPTETLTDFPVFVFLDGSESEEADAFFAAADENGAGLSVRDADGTVLAYELVGFSKETATAELWVRIPEFSSEHDTVITLSCDGEGAPGTVFGGDYDLALHMSGLREGDSSAKRNTLSSTGGITSVAGACGNALRFNGKDGYMVAGMPLPLVPEMAAKPINNAYKNTGYANPTGWNHAQGLTTDGEYLYFAGHFDSVNKGASIHKIRLSDMTEVDVFEHAGPLHSAILDYEPETDTIFASTGGDGRAAAVWELDPDDGTCLGKWDLRTLGYGGGAGVISLGNREILLYTSASDGAKIAFSYLALSENGAYTVKNEWDYTATDLGVGQGLDSLSRSGDGSFTVYYLADAGKSVSVDPHYIYQIRLTPGEPVAVEKRFHLSIGEETEGLTFLPRADGKMDVYFGSNAERIYKLDATLDALLETPIEASVSKNAFTLSCFVKVESTPNKYPGILGFGSASNNKNRFSLHLFGENEGKLRFGACLDDVWTKLDTDDGAFSFGTYHHVAAVYDGSMMRLYIDGSLYRTLGVSGLLTDYGAPFSIGADIENGTAAFFFCGAVDEVRLVHTVRSDAWIAAEAAMMP